MTVRTVFTIMGAVLAGLLLFAVVVWPAVERGGVGELAFVVAVAVAVLLAERWARSR